MPLDLQEVLRLASLARVGISDTEAEQTCNQLNHIFHLIEQMQAVDTSDVLPMAHAQNSVQRLREDVVTESDRRDSFQAIAPEAESGLYLVPRVIE